MTEADGPWRGVAAGHWALEHRKLVGDRRFLDVGVAVWPRAQANRAGRVDGLLCQLKTQAFTFGKQNIFIFSNNVRLFSTAFVCCFGNRAVSRGQLGKEFSC